MTLNGGQSTAPEPLEADRIKAIYRSYDTQERWLRKRDLANPGFSQLQAERRRKIAEIIGAGLRGVTPPRVVDIGCGKCSDLAHIARLLPDAELFEVDLSENRAEAARREVPSATLWVQVGEHPAVPRPVGPACGSLLCAARRGHSAAPHHAASARGPEPVPRLAGPLPAAGQRAAASQALPDYRNQAVIPTSAARAQPNGLCSVKARAENSPLRAAQ